jgi:hypothetical protein
VGLLILGINYWRSKILGKEIVGVQNSLGIKQKDLASLILGSFNFGGHNILGVNNFWMSKCFGVDNFLGEIKNVGFKFFGVNIIGG